MGGTGWRRFSECRRHRKPAWNSLTTLQVAFPKARVTTVSVHRTTQTSGPIRQHKSHNGEGVFAAAFSTAGERFFGGAKIQRAAVRGRHFAHFAHFAFVGHSGDL